MNLQDERRYGTERDRIRHTVWGQMIQAMLFSGAPVKLPANITLNEFLNIQKNAKFTQADRPAARFWCIGYGGHAMNKQADIPHIPDPIEHDPRDAGLYKPLPFVLRRPNNDLTDEQRLNYRLRRRETINGQEYIAYYLKKMVVEDDVLVFHRTTKNGKQDDVPYSATEENLAPVPPTLPPRHVVTAANSKLHVSNEARMEFNQFDVEELYEVAKIKFGDRRYAVVSEIGIVTACDVHNLRAEDGVTISEVKGAVIASFISSYHALYYANSGFIERVELGEKAPLFTQMELTPTVGTGVQG